MVDLHAHILPGIDDGAENLQESIQMCRMAYQDGIRTIVATPHVGKFSNTKEIIIKKIDELKERIDNIVRSSRRKTEEQKARIESNSIIIKEIDI